MSYPLNDESSRNFYSLQFLYQFRKSGFLPGSSVLLESVALYSLVESLLNLRDQGLSSLLIASSNKFPQGFNGVGDLGFAGCIKSALA